MKSRLFCGRFVPCAQGWCLPHDLRAGEKRPRPSSPVMQRVISKGSRRQRVLKEVHDRATVRWSRCSAVGDQLNVKDIKATAAFAALGRWICGCLGRLGDGQLDGFLKLGGRGVRRRSPSLALVWTAHWVLRRPARGMLSDPSGHGPEARRSQRGSCL